MKKKLYIKIFFCFLFNFSFNFYLKSNTLKNHLLNLSKLDHKEAANELNEIIYKFNDKERRKKIIINKEKRAKQEKKLYKHKKGFLDTPIVSFIIPCFNREKTIEQAINSIYYQDIKVPFEVICVDDCSTDSTFKILSKLEKQHKNLFIYKNKKNKRPPKTINKAIIRADADIIFDLDSDDFLPKNHFNSLYKYIKKNNFDTLYANGAYFFNDFDPSNIQLKYKIPYKEFSIQDIIFEPSFPAPCICKFFSKKSWFLSGGLIAQDGHYGWGFSFQQLASGSKFDIAPESFYYHRIWSDEHNHWRECHRNKILYLNPLYCLKDSPEIFTEKSNKLIQNYNFNRDGDFFEYFIKEKKLKLINKNALDTLFKAYTFEYEKKYNLAKESYIKAIQLGCTHPNVYLKLMRVALHDNDISLFKKYLREIINLQG